MAFDFSDFPAIQKFLEEQGLSVAPTRFPYTYHHDYWRRWLQKEKDWDDVSRMLVADQAAHYREAVGDKAANASLVWYAFLYIVSQTTPETIALALRIDQIRRFMNQLEQEREGVESFEDWALRVARTSLDVPDEEVTYKRYSFGVFKDVVAPLLKSQYGLSIDDIEEFSIAASYSNKETPQDCVNWLARELDLTRIPV